MTIRLAARRGRRTTAVPALIALGALVALVATAAPASATTRSASTPVLALGAGMGAKPSPAVRRVQRVLDHRGYHLGAPGVDGRFGPLTDAAVRRLQADTGLVVDGVVGSQTRKALGLTRRVSRRQPRPAAAQPPQAEPAPKAKAPVTAPEPVQAPTSRTVVTAVDGPSSLWLIALGGLCALLATALALVVRSTRAEVRAIERGTTPEAAPPAASDPEALPAPLDEELIVEGHSEHAGDFHGRAVASTVTHPWNRPDEVQRRYLVDDPGKGQPFWVGQNEIRRLTTRLKAGGPGSAAGRRRAWRPRIR